MTPPSGPNNSDTRARVTDRRGSQWLIELVAAALGAVILVAAATTGRVLSGVVWFAVLSTGGALSAAAARFEAARRGRCPDDQRATTINTRAMSIAGTLLVIAITGCAAFTLVRGESSSPYTALLALGGISYALASLALRYEKS